MQRRKKSVEIIFAKRDKKKSFKRDTASLKAKVSENGSEKKTAEELKFNFLLIFALREIVARVCRFLFIVAEN